MKLIDPQNVTFLVIIISFATQSSLQVWAQENNNNDSQLLSSIFLQAKKVLNDTDVDFATNIEFIKGHLSAAITNKLEGNNELTQTHSFHPITEIYTLIRDKLSVTDNRLNDTLAQSLSNLTSIVFSSTTDEFVQSAGQVKDLLSKAIIKTIPENQISDIRFNTSVLINLLKTAESEYKIGVVNASIVNMAEYQDARGFVASASELLNKTIQSLNQTFAQKFSPVKDMFYLLDNSLNNKDDNAKISMLISNITTTIPEILNLNVKDLSITVASDTASSELIGNIRELIKQVLEKIGEGNYPAAESLAVEAYLDNYEFLEGEIVKHDKPLMEDTENLLRIQLLDSIKGNASLDDIQKIIDILNSKLDIIENILK